MTENSAQEKEGCAVEKSGAAAQGFGAQLSKAREAAGLSLDDVASRTKISRNQLEALEAESIRLLPEPVYVRAFIRDICRVTGADPQPVIRAYMEGCAPEEQKVPDLESSAPVPGHGLAKEVEFRASPRKRGLRVLIAFAVLVLLALFVWAGWGQDLVARISGGEAEAVKVTQPGEVAPLQQPRSPSNALPADAPVMSEPAAASSSAPSSSTASDAAAAASAETAAGGAPKDAQQPAAAPGQAVVEVRTVGSSWLRMVDADGKVLVKEELGAGVEKTFSGKLPISVTVGNTRSCAMTLDGRPVDLSAYSRGSVARFVLNP